MSLSTKEAVLKALLQADGDWISGARLADSIFVSRNAVWQAVQALLQTGYPVESVTGRGYRLKQVATPLSETGINLHLNDPEHFKIILYDCLPSTNNTLKKIAREGADDGLVILARSQSAGRGRLGRSYFSPPETGLYFSLLLRPGARQSVSQEAAALPLAAWPAIAAVATALAIEDCTHADCQIKWVNDLYMAGKKVGGILTEAELDLESGTPSFVVIGIGLNLEEPVNGFPPDLSDIAGSIWKQANPTAKAKPRPWPDYKNRLVADILNRLIKLVDQNSSEELHSAYCKRSLLTGKTVKITSGGQSFRARVTGIGRDFSLEVEDVLGRKQSISCGEASLHDNAFYKQIKDKQ